MFSADPGLGLVYVPLGNPSPDLWGGLRRPFDEAYGSSLVALDIATGVPLPLGKPNTAGSLVTAGGLIFFSGTLDNYLRAYDIGTGRELWRARLPAGGQATPMSYVGTDGGGNMSWSQGAAILDCAHNQATRSWPLRYHAGFNRSARLRLPH